MSLYTPKFLTILALSVIGCESSPVPDSIDLDSFELATAFTDLDLAKLSPTAASGYVELRKQLAFGRQNEYEVLGTAGEICSNAEKASECQAQFSELLGSVSDGFYPIDHPSDKFHYLAVTQAGMATIVGRESSMRSFLGTIDNETEAFMLVAAYGYWWSATAKSEGAIRRVDTGFEVIAEETSFCAEHKRYLLHVAFTGDVTELENWVLNPGSTSCG
tara:strand:- start:86601 stop:87254 length:654 start_codon:yes stop_codon:yes gene_type:complete